MTRAGDTLAFEADGGRVVFAATNWGGGTVSGDVIESGDGRYSEGDFFTCPRPEASPA